MESFPPTTGVEGLSDAEVALIVAAVGIAGSLLVAVVGAWFSVAARRREERRRLYGEAVRAALVWVEMVYRVRRRRKDQAAELVEFGHKTQEDLTYYQGWIGSESAYMRLSYERLVRVVKSNTESLINDAWLSGIRPAPGNAVEGDIHPDIDKPLGEFLKDVRSHTSAIGLRKLGVWKRNRGRAEQSDDD